MFSFEQKHGFFHRRKQRRRLHCTISDHSLLNASTGSGCWKWFGLLLVYSQQNSSNCALCFFRRSFNHRPAQQSPSCRGKTFAWTASFLHSFLSLLSLSSMALQMVDRYLAVCWPLFYKANTSREKIIAIILIKWLIILTIVLLVYIPLYDIDIGNSSVLEYRELYAKQSGQKLSRYVVPVFVLMILFGGLSLWNLKRRPGQVAVAPHNAHNSPSVRVRKRAIYTILILLIIALISYLPAVIRSRVWLELESQAKLWVAFVIIFTLSVPSALNPFIVLIRVKHFSDKLKALINGFKLICCKNQADVRVYV